MPFARFRRSCLRALFLGLAAIPALAAAEGPGRSEAPAPAPSAAAVPLDRLLKLPESFTSRVPPPTRAGASQKEWQDRFQQARDDIAEARVALARVQRELEETASASNTWQVAAPGQPPQSETSPLSFRLTQELKRRREQLGQAEADLQDLEIQANLAGVPEDWR